jgi:hypothetical protein
MHAPHASPLITHFHVSAPSVRGLFILRVLLGAAPSGRRVVTFHHGSLSVHYREGGLGISLLRWFPADVRIVALNWEQQEFFSRANLRAEIVRGSSYVRSTRLPSVGEPPIVEESSGRCVIASSGYEQEYYGFVGLVRAVADMPRPAELRLFTYGPRNETLIEQLRAEAETLSVPLAIHRELDRSQFLTKLSQCNVYARNSVVDSFGIAVAEARDLGLQTVATNVCDRPSGVILVSACDHAELVSALEVACSTSRSLPVGKEFPSTAQAEADANLHEYLKTYGLL